MDFVVAFDVGSESLHNGFFQVACDALRKILYGSEGEEGHWPGKSRLSIITFDRTLHFYDLSVCLFPSFSLASVSLSSSQPHLKCLHLSLPTLTNRSSRCEMVYLLIP